MLSALAMRIGRPVTAEQLADALWGGRPPASWAKVVQGCVSRLRQGLGSEAIATTASGYRLESALVEVDRDAFDDLVARAREQADTGSPERAASLLVEALALWRGQPFDALEEWEPGRLEVSRLIESRRTAEEDLLQARLDAGKHRQVAEEGTVMVGEEPWRERRWAMLALAQYRCGRQADALATIRTARRQLDRELGLEPGSDLVDLERRILAQDPALAAEHEARVAALDCPWRGLAPYRAEDHDSFYGRAAEVRALLDRLGDTRLLVLAGPSGSGKSSLMNAGIAPALGRRDRDWVAFSPGMDGPAAMTVALAGAGPDPMLLVDQFEEAFTLADPGPAAAWLAELATYAHERGPVVVTVRADQLVHLTLDGDFARLAEAGMHPWSTDWNPAPLRHRGAGRAGRPTAGAWPRRPGAARRRGPTRRSAPALACAHPDLAAPGGRFADSRGDPALRRDSRSRRGIRGPPLRKPVARRAGAAASATAANGAARRQRRAGAQGLPRFHRGGRPRSWTCWSGLAW